MSPAPQPGTPEFEAMLVRHSKPVAKQPEVIPALEVARPIEWSATDPMAVQRAARAVIKYGDYDAAREATECPEDIWAQITGDSEFQSVLSDAARTAMFPALVKAAPQFIKDSAYGAKVVSEMFKPKQLEEADADFARALRVGGTKAKLRAIDDLILRLFKAREMLSGGAHPAPEKIAAIVKTVTEQAA